MLLYGIYISNTKTDKTLLMEVMFRAWDRSKSKDVISLVRVLEAKISIQSYI